MGPMMEGPMGPIMEGPMGPMEEGPMEEGFMGAMWNGVFYGPGDQAAYEAAQIADPTGGQNGGMGAGGGGGGGGGGGAPSVKTATAGQDFLNGTNGVQDTFVFTLGQEAGAGSPVTTPPEAGIGANTASADMLANFSRADGDKIKLFEVDGVTPIANPISGSTLGLMSDGFGGTAVYVVGSSGVLFNTNSPDVANLQDSDFTVA